MRAGDKVEHPIHGTGIARQVYADGTADVDFAGAEFNISQLNRLGGLPKPPTTVKRKPKAQNDGEHFFMHDRKRGYVAEILNALPRFNGRITHKEKNLPFEEQEALRREAALWLNTDGLGFEDLTYDLLQAYGGDFIAIELPWQLWRRSSTDLTQLVETVRRQSDRAYAREQKISQAQQTGA